MIGSNDATLFLSTEEFAERITLSTGRTIDGIYDIDEDNEFGGLVEGRKPSILIANADYLAHKGALAHGQQLTIASVNYLVESTEPYGADRAFTVVMMRFA